MSYLKNVCGGGMVVRDADAFPSEANSHKEGVVLVVAFDNDQLKQPC